MKTKRQLLLYRYLINHGGDYWRTKEEIVDVACPGLYPRAEIEPNSRSHQLLDDIKAINNNPEFEKIIIFKNNLIKIANEEEAKEYANQFLKKGLIQLKHFHCLRRKIESEGQGQFESESELKFIERYLSESERRN